MTISKKEKIIIRRYAYTGNMHEMFKCSAVIWNVCNSSYSPAVDVY